MDERTPTFLIVAGAAGVMLANKAGANAERVRMAGWIALAAGVALKASNVAQRVSEVGLIGTAAGAVVGDRAIDAASSFVGPILETAGNVAGALETFTVLPVSEFAKNLRGDVDKPPPAETIIGAPSGPVVIAPAAQQPALIADDGEPHGIVSGPNAMAGVLAAIVDPLQSGSVSRPIGSSKFPVRLALQNLTDTPKTPAIVAVVKVSTLTQSYQKIQELRKPDGSKFTIAPRSRLEVAGVLIDSGTKFEIGDVDVSITLRVDGKLAQSISFEVT